MNSYILFKDQRLNSGMMIADNLFLKENKAGSFRLLKKRKNIYLVTLQHLLTKYRKDLCADKGETYLWGYRCYI